MGEPRVRRHAATIKLSRDRPNTLTLGHDAKTSRLQTHRGIGRTEQQMAYSFSSIKLREGKPKHTIPTVIFPDGTWVDESLDIAKKINDLYPEPKLALETPAFTSLASNILPGLMTSLRPIYMSLVPARLLNEASLPYWMETRSEIVGKSPDAVTDADRDAAWKEVEKSGVLAQVTDLLKANGGPFFEGKEVSYVDFVWVGFLIFCRRLDILDKALSLTGDESVHRKLLAAAEPWSKRDDH